MTFDPNAPAPGRYDGIDIDTYGAAKGVRRSELMALEDGTDKDLRHYQAQGVPSSPALRVGSATDCLVFEPHLFDEMFVAMPDWDDRKAGLLNKVAFLAERNGLPNESDGMTVENLKVEVARLKSLLPQTILPYAEAELSHRCAAATLAARAVRQLLDARTSQPSYFWTQSTFSGIDVPVKARPDARVEGRHRLADLKTCQSLADRDLQNSIIKWGYDVQAAMCFEGATKAGEEPEQWVWIWTRKVDPIDVRVVVLGRGSDWMILGERRYARLLDRYARIQESNQLLGHAHDPTVLPLPQWASRLSQDAEQYEVEARKQHRETPTA